MTTELVLPPLPTTLKRLVSYPTNKVKPTLSQIRYPNFIELMEDTLYHFIENFFVIIILAILPYIILIFGIIFPIVSLKFLLVNQLINTPPSMGVVIPILLIYLLILLILELWLQTSFFYLIAHLEEKPSISEILSNSFGKMWSLSWVTSLFILLFIGGGLFLIIPGIILLILSIFAPFVLLVEEVGGYGALQISRLRLSKCLGSLLQRLILFVGTICIIYIIVGVIYNTPLKNIANILNYILNITVPVIFLIFLGRNYHAIRWLTIEQPLTPSAASKITYFVLTIIPLIILAGLVVINFHLISTYISSITLFHQLPPTVSQFINLD